MSLLTKLRKYIAPSLLLCSAGFVVWLLQDREKHIESFWTKEGIGSEHLELSNTAQPSLQLNTISMSDGLEIDEPDSREAIDAFEEWMVRYFERDAIDRDQLIGEGVGIASRRRVELKKLIQTDPELALALAIPYEIRRQLPREILEQLETPVSKHALYELLVFCPEPGKSGDGFMRVATSGEKTYDVYVYGRRVEVASKDRLSIHGIAIEEALALTEDPIRILSAAECEDRRFDAELVVAVGGSVFGLEDQETLLRLREILEDDERALGPRPSVDYKALRQGDLEGLSVLFMEDSEYPIYENELPEIQSDHTEGPKTMLYIRARFSDQEADYEPNDLATLQARQADCEAFWFENSYGKSSLSTTFTDVIALPNSASSYADLTSGRLKKLFDDALPLVKAAGAAKGQDWDYETYDFYTMLTTGGKWGYAGVAGVGGRRSHLNGAGSSNVRTASHEFGHNLGLRHANYWRTDSTSPIGRDSLPGGYVGDAVGDERIEYGHKFSVMSAQNGNGDFNEGRGHYSTGEKVKLDWLVDEDGDWVSIDQSTSTPIRLYRHDVESELFGTMASGVTRAIKINRDSGDYAENNKRRYWLSFRRLPTNGVSGDWLPYGLQVDWQREVYGNDGSILLDMTPYSNDDSNPKLGSGRDNPDKADAVLVVGRTYSDTVADIHFTPIAYGGENPNEWIDVLVNLETQHNNTAPEITAFTSSEEQVDTGQPVEFQVQAEDADGDPLYYSWSFGDGLLQVESLNTSTASKSWEEKDIYTVRVTVSDGKGGTASREIYIEVGDLPGVRAIQGRVLWAGMPVEGARVSIGDEEQAWTDSSGVYVFPSITEQINQLKAAMDGLQFEPLFSNPVYVFNLDVLGRDWIAIDEGPASGGLRLAVTPFQTSVPLGTQLKFEALAWDTFGKPVEPSPIWSVSGGGSIDEVGILTATELGGPFSVTARQDGVEAQAFVVISDFDAVGVAALTQQVMESDATQAIFRFRRYGSTDERLFVRFDLRGAAVDGKDFWRRESSADFEEGESVKDIVIHLLNDYEAEGTEDLRAEILQDSAYTIYSPEAAAQVDILDDGDQAPVIQVATPRASPVFLPAGSGLLIETEVVDDGFPNPPGNTTVHWSVLEAPENGTALLSPPQGNNAVATFSKAGFYRILGTASDGINTGVAEIAVHAGLVPGMQPSSEFQIVYFPMDEAAGVTLGDGSGGDNNGELVNGPIWADGDAAISGSAIQLDGFDDQIDIPDAAEINLLDHSKRTIALWFRADNPSESRKQVLYEEGGGIRGLNIYLDSGKLYVGGWNSGANSWEETYLSTDLMDTDWHHVALVLDAEPIPDLQPETLRGYLDGIEFGSGGSATLDSHSGDIAMGANRGATKYHNGNASGTGDFFAGWIDEFYLWNRALQAEEVAQLVSRGYLAPEVSLASSAYTQGSVLVPEGMGMILEGQVSEDNGVTTNWSEVVAPEGGSASFVDPNQRRVAVTFSQPGYYVLRFSADDGEQKAAMDVQVHYGRQGGVNPVIANESTYFSMDEGAGNASQNGGYDEVQLLLSEKAVWAEAGDAISGSALVLRDVENFQTIFGRTQLEENGRQKTFALWFKPDLQGTEAKEVIFETGDEGNGFNLYLEGDLLWAGSWSGKGDDWFSFIPAVIERDRWHHVALVMDVESFENDKLDPNGLRFFLNGSPVGFAPAGYIQGSSRPGLGGVNFTTVFHDGTLALNQLYPFSGIIDEFHYYHDYALSIDEIGQLYAFGNVGPVVDAGTDQSGLVSLVVDVMGSATDDSRWNDSLTYLWGFVDRSGAGSFTSLNESGSEARLDLLAGGSYRLFLGANDGQVTTFDERLISVDQPTYFDLFMEDFASLTPDQRGYDANPDGDLRNNLEEYGLGGVADSYENYYEYRLKLESLTTEGQTFGEFRYPRRKDATLRGLEYEFQWSQTLNPVSWSSDGVVLISLNSIDAEFEEVRVRVEMPLADQNDSLFGRLIIRLNE